MVLDDRHRYRRRIVRGEEVPSIHVFFHPRRLARAIAPLQGDLEKGVRDVVLAVRTITELQQQITWTPHSSPEFRLLFLWHGDDRRWT